MLGLGLLCAGKGPGYFNGGHYAVVCLGHRCTDSSRAL